MADPVVIVVLAAILAAGYSFNFIWDRTVRRRRARALTQSRRDARPRALPAAAGSTATSSPAVEAFVRVTRSTAVTLDDILERFDLELLRARDRAAVGTVVVEAEAPREQAAEALRGWLAHVDAVWSAPGPDEQAIVDQLARHALSPNVIREIVGREQWRASFEMWSQSTGALEETIADLDKAVIYLQAVAQALEAGADPYR